MTVNPADDPVLRLLEEAGLGEDPALAAVLTELQATAAAEPPAPSRDVARLMSGRRPIRSSWFASRGARTTTVVLLAAALAGGASAAAASPAFHAVVDDAFSSLATLVRLPAHPGPAAHPEPAEPEHASAGGTGSTQPTGGRAGSTERPGTAEAGDAQGAPASPPSSGRKDDGAERPSAAGAQSGAGTQSGTLAPVGEDATTGESGKSVGQSAGKGDDPGTSGSSTQKRAPAHFEPMPSPAPSAAGSPVTQGDPSDSREQSGSGR